MKRLIILFCLTLFASAQSYADPSDTMQFTVIAPSGLSLRSKPTVNSQRLDLVPFETRIDVVGQYHEIYDPQNIDTIDQRLGYWFKTSYKGKEGYLFSGYLKTGDLYQPSTHINMKYRIMTPGLKCQALNYDPDLYWYGLYYDKKLKKTKARSVNIKIDYGGIPMEELEMAYAQQSDFSRVSSDSRDACFIFIGSKSPLVTGELENEKSFLEKEDPDDWRVPGKFVYPYERFKIAKMGYTNYYIVGHEQTSIKKYEYNDQEFVQRTYKLFLSNNKGNGVLMNNRDTVDLSEGLTEHISNYEYSAYRGPKLQWMGDLNGDGFPELIYYTPNMSESCGGSEVYHFLMSEKSKDHFLLKKVAEEEIYSCHGC